MLLLSVVTALIQATFVSPVSPDSVDALREAAQHAEERYERLLRSLAPRTWGSGSGGGGSCDEVVGRFCLRYDTGTEEPPALEDSSRIIVARREAVEALRRAFAVAPGELGTAAPLVRYLVEDGRVGEAVSAARTFAWASQDPAWGSMLLAFALHQAARDTVAIRHFETALERLPPDEAAHVTSIDVLLSSDEEDLYEDLPDPERAAYEAAFWTLADPLYLTPGNESRAEHLARHVWARALSQAPRVAGMHRWGDDLKELTIRYGVPTSRARRLDGGFSAYPTRLSDQMVEWWDPDQLMFVPPALRTEGPSAAPPPGESWSLDTTRARAGYSPATIRRMVPLPHQLSRFPAGDAVVLRLDGLLPLDSMASGATAVEAGLFILDPEYDRIHEARTFRPVDDDTVALAFELTLPPGHYVYSLEALEHDSRFAGRARYRVALDEQPPDAVALSDLLVAFPFGTGRLPTGRTDAALQPRADLVLAPGDTVGLYAEVHHLEGATTDPASYRIELAVRRTDAPAFPVRALRWLGRTLGITDPPLMPRLAWQARSERDGPAVIAVDLGLGELDPGMYAIELAVTDQRSGIRRQVERLIRVRLPPGDSE